MRISDWSSDVCSSDLVRGAGGRALRVAGRRRLCRAGALARPGRCLRVGVGGVAGRVAEGAGAGGAAGLRLARRKEAPKPGWEIGRAPCRERGCQYVWITGVAGTLK